MLPGHIKDVFGSAALEYLIERVELLRLRQLGDISSVDKERRRSRHRVNAIESNFERLGNILVRLLVKPDVAIADLQKAKIGSLVRAIQPLQFLQASLTRGRRRLLSRALPCRPRPCILESRGDRCRRVRGREKCNLT